MRQRIVDGKVLLRCRYDAAGAALRGPDDQQVGAQGLELGVTCACTPVPRAIMAITAPTPMMMPSMARSERSLLAQRLLKALMMMVQRSMGSPTSRPARLTPRPGWATAWLRHFAGDDLAVADVDLALAVVGDLEVVGDDDDGAALPVELFEEGEDFLAGAGIQGAGGFVGQDDRRVGDDGAGDGDALPLTAGKLVGLVMAAFAQADDRRGLRAPFSWRWQHRRRAGAARHFPGAFIRGSRLKV